MGKLSKGAQNYLDTALATRSRPPPEALARVKQSVLQITNGAGADADEAPPREPGAADPGEALPGRGAPSGAGAGTPGAATQAGSLAAKVASGWGAKLAIGVLALGAVGVGTSLVTRSGRETSAPPPAHEARASNVEQTATASSVEQTATAPSGEQAAAPQPDAPARAVPPLTTAPPAKGPGVAPAGALPEPPSTRATIAGTGSKSNGDGGALAPSLATELAVLREAQRAMREGRPANALDILDRNAPLFRGSPLDAERRATRLLALCKASPGEEAKRAATRFLAESPGSPLAASVRQACALGREEP